MASLINLTVLSPSDTDDFNSPCQPIAFNVANIQDIEDYSSTLHPGAKSKVNVKYVVANHFKSKTIYVNEVRTAIVTSSNA